MIPICFLAALLALAEPAADCQRDDNACKARRHERRARAATTPEDRAYYLHLAHRSYLFAFDRSRDPADLCAARRNFDASPGGRGSVDEAAREHGRRPGGSPGPRGSGQHGVSEAGPNATPNSKS